MTAAPVPSDEKERIRLLRSLDILDTEAEERFDNITRLAKKLFNVPIALVSLVDSDRQWFKSAEGLEATETHRDYAFCAHTILKDLAMVVTNAVEDVRFADNPLVQGPPFIRFYAGYPLKVMGHNLGTLCIIDSQPREMSNEDIESLKDLAKVVEREITANALATIDPLTSILNRRGFIAQAEKNLAICKRQNLTSTLIFFDLNNFKSINDSYGHNEGDKALCTFSQSLSKTIRASDICGRLGGDEFVIWLISTNKRHIPNLLKRLQTNLMHLSQTNRLDCELAFSAGEHFIDPEENVSLDSHLKQADQKMYQKKNVHKPE